MNSGRGWKERFATGVLNTASLLFISAFCIQTVSATGINCSCCIPPPELPPFPSPFPCDTELLSYVTTGNYSITVLLKNLTVLNETRYEDHCQTTAAPTTMTIAPAATTTTATTTTTTAATTEEANTTAGVMKNETQTLTTVDEFATSVQQNAFTSDLPTNVPAFTPTSDETRPSGSGDNIIIIVVSVSGSGVTLIVIAVLVCIRIRCPGALETFRKRCNKVRNDTKGTKGAEVGEGQPYYNNGRQVSFETDAELKPYGRPPLDSQASTVELIPSHEAKGQQDMTSLEGSKTVGAYNKLSESSSICSVPVVGSYAYENPVFDSSDDVLESNTSIPDGNVAAPKVKEQRSAVESTNL